MLGIGISFASFQRFWAVVAVVVVQELRLRIAAQERLLHATLSII